MNVIEFEPFCGGGKGNQGVVGYFSGVWTGKSSAGEVKRQVQAKKQKKAKRYTKSY